MDDTDYEPEDWGMCGYDEDGVFVKGDCYYVYDGKRYCVDCLPGNVEPEHPEVTVHEDTIVLPSSRGGQYLCFSCGEVIYKEKQQ